MSRSNFIFGIALLVVATTMAVMITLRPAPNVAAAGPTATGHQSAGDTRALSALPPGERRGETAVPRAKLRPRPVSASPRESVFTVKIPGLETPGSTISAAEQQLVSQARAVEQEAREKLEQLTGELDLSHAQRTKLFPILARSSGSYDPAMIIGDDFAATPAEPTTIEDEIHSELDPDQKIAYEEDVMDDALWWQDILGQIEADLANATGTGTVEPAAGTGTGTATPTDPDPGTSGGTEVDPGAGSSLLDLIGN